MEEFDFSMHLRQLFSGSTFCSHCFGGLDAPGFFKVEIKAWLTHPDLSEAALSELEVETERLSRDLPGILC